MTTRSIAGFRSRALQLAKWTPAAIVLTETAVGSYWDLARIPYVREVFDHLGYPMYFAPILGTAKVAALAAVLTPGHPRAKEWAYAGLAFVYGGAAASHLAVGDGPDKWATPLLFVACTFGARAWLPAGHRVSSRPASAR
ncbi:DoxX family protein [Nocardia wallacei]|uniref:DoxX family protein n=1 Tax=Nocardia wallacei TaxID=480035 RepID=UPI002455ECE1|nr:DoxX family protein [Nocardia wallacei]